MIFKGDGNQGELNGFLDSGSHIQGDLRFDDTFRIDGRLTGRVVSAGDLIVGEGGSIEGEIQVARIYVSGVVKGQVHATERLEIGPKGKMYADVQTAVLVIEDGAFFEGRCSMAKKGVASAPQVVPLQKGVGGD